MKKFLRIPLAVSILCMSVGCGGDSTENPDPSTDPPTPPVTEDTIAFPDEVPPAPLFPEKGGEQTLSFTSAAAWTARVSDPIPAAGAGDATRAAADWLSVSPRSGAAGAATIRVVALPNDTDSDRTGIVTLQAGTASQLLTVTQLRRGALVAATESITVDNAGGEVPIVVSSNVEFDITIDGDWITPVETRALTRDTLRFRIDENRGYDNRMGTITFSSKDKTIEQEVKIYQAQKDALVVSPTDNVFDEKGQTFEIEVRANVEFTVENPDVVWLRPVETRGLKTHTLRYRVDENTTYDSRSAEIRIVDTKRNLSQTVTVTQSQKDALVVAESSYTMPQEGGEITVEVTRNVPIDITIGAGWITQVETRGLITEQLRFRIAENPNTGNRESVIVFESKDHEIRQEVKIYQAQKDALVVSPTDNVFDEKGQTFEIEVRTNVEFTVENPDVVWLRPVETRGLKTHTLRYRLDENTTYDSRSAEIRIVDTKRNISQVVTVTQTQKDALVVAQSSYTLPQEGGEIAVDVTRNVPIDITIGAGWITQVETRGLITEHLRFRIAENPGDNHREGVIVFESKDHEIRQEVRIVQQGRPDEEAVVREYLVRLYRDTDGDNWRNNTNWCSDQPINEWYGATYQNGKLQLVLRSNTLRGTIDLAGCTALTSLSCSDNQLTGLDVFGCTALTDLNCGGNRLTSLDVSSCTALEKLYCYENLLTNLDVSGCTALKKLTWSSLYSNPLISVNFSGCTSLEILNIGEYCSMTSLDVSGCTALKELFCNGLELTSLDLSNCTALTKLNCSNNQLTDLDVSDCTILTSLDCSENLLPVLNISGCTVLKRLDCNSNQLTSMDISGHTALIQLDCCYNRLTSLDISRCTALKNLSWYGNQLTGLNISGCTSLEKLDFSVSFSNKSPLTSLDVSDCTALKELLCSGHQLTRLVLTGCTALTKLNCSNNQLTSLDVSDNMAFAQLNCSNNQLTRLEVTGYTALIELDCGKNQLTSLDVSGCVSLTELKFGFNPLKNLNVSGTALGRLTYYYTDYLTYRETHTDQLVNLNASGCTSLYLLDFSCNKLTSLNVSGCTALKYLTCYDNQLTSLDVSSCTALEELYCHDNQLTSLDVSRCKVLTTLQCYKNQLSRLIVSGCIALKDLECSDNQLSRLIVSGCIALKDLWCSDNQLTGLDVSGCKELGRLACFNNLLTSLDVSGCTVLTSLGCGNNQLTYITGFSDCISLQGINTRKNSICQQIPSWARSIFLRDYNKFDTDGSAPNWGFWIDGYRYEYYQVWNEALGEFVTHYRDLGVGWWYPGEPGSLHNGW